MSSRRIRQLSLTTRTNLTTCPKDGAYYNSGECTMWIRGLSWSWRRAIGLTGARQRLARQIGCPTTMDGLQRAIGRFLLRLLTGGRL
jgi:hypothetical protein